MGAVSRPEVMSNLSTHDDNLTKTYLKEAVLMSQDPKCTCMLWSMEIGGLRLRVKEGEG